jgi:hypothetical protein
LPVKLRIKYVGWSFLLRYFDDAMHVDDVYVSEKLRFKLVLPCR